MARYARSRRRGGAVAAVATVEWTRDEILRVIEEEAQRRRRQSAAQLLSAYRQGTLEDPGDVVDLLALADLLNDDDPIFAAA